MPVLKGSGETVLIPCANRTDERAGTAVRRLGLRPAWLFTTSFYDLNEPAPVRPAAYVKRLLPEAIVSAARVLGAQAVFSPFRQPELEALCRSAGIDYLDPQLAGAS